jgi:hypothetical protein
MALTQTHLDLRSDLSDKLLSLTTEALSLATSVARHAAIGTLSVADGGAASTGETAVVVDALVELLSATVGNPDFGGVNPSFASATIVGGNLSTTQIAVATVSDLLASPLVVLRPVAGGADINVSGWTSFSATSARTIGGISHPQKRVKIGPIPAAARAAFNAAYFVVVKNPLDLVSVEAVSVGSATFVYAG